MNNASMNGYRFAELATGESLTSPDTCDCCERTGLKKTVKLVNPAGRVVWFGVGCAARAMGCEPMVVRKARADALTVAEENARKARQEAAKKEDDRWQCFLDRASGALNGGGTRDRFEQIRKLGGMAVARESYRSWCAKVGESWRR
jgi:hypothetical protein